MATGLTLGSCTSKYHWILVRRCVRDGHLVLEGTFQCRHDALPKSESVSSTVVGLIASHVFSMEKDGWSANIYIHLLSTSHPKLLVIGDLRNVLKLNTEKTRRVGSIVGSRHQPWFVAVNPSFFIRSSTCIPMVFPCANHANHHLWTVSAP
jgi:hypothetical protein